MLLDSVTASAGMAKKPELPQWVKDNLRAWTIHLRVKQGGTQGEFAKHIGVSQPVISKAENRGEMGLDVLIKMSTVCGEKIDDLVRFKPRGRSGERTANPNAASSDSAHPGRRGRTGRV